MKFAEFTKENIFVMSLFAIIQTIIIHVLYIRTYITNRVAI